MDKLKFKEDLNEIYSVRLKLLKNKPENELNELDKTFTVNDINSESSIEVIF